jgi:hypothetical protein
MVVDQKMDVGDVGRKSRLVEKDTDHDGTVDGQHRPPRAFQSLQSRSAPLDISGRAAETPLASYIELRTDG